MYNLINRKKNVFAGSAVTQLKVYLAVILCMGVAVWLLSFTTRKVVLLVKLFTVILLLLLLYNQCKIIDFIF